MKGNLIKLLTLIVLTAVNVSAFSAPVTVTSYDITGYHYGNDFYGHYDGTVTKLGEGNYTYSGGGGSLNDGYVTEQYKPVAPSTYLFYFDETPTITLHLSEKTLIYSLDFISFLENNLYTGSLGGLNVTINGETRFIETEDFGPGNKWRDHTNDRLSLAGSGLEDLLTDTIVLSGFVRDQAMIQNQYSVIGFYLSEITVDGNPAPQSAALVSEPAGLALLAAGIAGLGFIRRRKNTM